MGEGDALGLRNHGWLSGGGGSQRLKRWTPRWMLSGAMILGSSTSSGSSSLNTLPVARDKWLQRTGESSPCVHFLTAPCLSASSAQDPAAASISDGDCDARGEGESVAMNYKPSPLQVKLGECVGG